MRGSEAMLNRSDVCVIGLGYVGLPTALLFAQAGLRVRGVDVDEGKLERLRSADAQLEQGVGELLVKQLWEGNFEMSNVPQPSHCFVIAVPTPVDANSGFDSSFIRAALEAIVPHLLGDELIVLESTSPPGTTAWMKSALEQKGISTKDLDFAHCPERVLPGAALEELVQNDRVLGGLTEQASRRAADLYARFGRGYFVLSDATTAELSKVVENAYRDVNIAFANEVSMICASYGVSPESLIGIANRHPRVDILTPGIGVGGHCISVDPWFLIQNDQLETRLMRSARAVNDYKTQWIAEQLAGLLNERGISELVLHGLSYKPDTNDFRNSPAVALVRHLAQLNPALSITAMEPYITGVPTELQELPNVNVIFGNENGETGEIRGTAAPVMSHVLELILVPHSIYAGSQIPSVTEFVHSPGLRA